MNRPRWFALVSCLALTATALVTTSAAASTNTAPIPTPAAATPISINGQLHVCGTKLCNQYNKPILRISMCVARGEDGYETGPRKSTDLVSEIAERHKDKNNKKIGWTNWNFSDDERSGAVFKEGTCAGNNFTGTSVLKQAGVWTRDRVRTADDFPTTLAAAPAVTINVTTAAQLKTALTSAKPGDTIKLADGTYTGNFKTTVSGTSSAPIKLSGTAKAVLTAGGGYGLHLNGASYWQVSGITVTGGQKGIMIDNATRVVIDGVTVHGLDMEGVHFRNSSTYGTIKNSKIFDTGNDGRGMGEGVYVGSAGGLEDKSDNVQILDNTIGPDVGGEAVDLKEGTKDGRVAGNSFDGRGLTGANFDDSWIDVKGNNYLIENNTGKNTTNNGYETHTQQDGWGCGTTFRNNKSDLTGATGTGRYAFNITNYNASTCKVTIDRSNTITGGKALTNPGIPVT